MRIGQLKWPLWRTNSQREPYVELTKSQSPTELEGMPFSHAAHLLVNDVQDSNGILPAPSLAHGIDEGVEGHDVCLKTICLPHP